jgi:hypothetical protein
MKSAMRVSGKDIVVLVLSVGLLVCNLAAVGNSGRERAKRVVCHANLR